MTYWLSSTICAAVHGQELLLLDTDTGLYSCMPAVGDQLRIAPDGAVEVDDPALAAALVGLGVIAGAPNPARAPLPDRPSRDLGLDRRARADAAALATLAAASWDMVFGYWRAAFPELVRRARVRQGAALRPGGDAELRRHALQFRELLPFVPFQGECLFRSVMLQAYLRRRGLASTLVIGCQTWPFEAHCWVQAGDLVLDDGVDHVGGFTPLLAI